MISLMVVDDHQVIRTGMHSLLADTDIVVVAEAATGRDAVRIAEEKRPDVILLDIRMPDGDGLSALEELRRKVPDSRVVMCSTYDNPTYAARAFALGASDFHQKGMPREDLIAVIRAAAAGESPIGLDRLNRVKEGMELPQGTDEDVPLTQRETQVLRHVALGLSNREISNSLQISVQTVKEHLASILRKIGLGDRTQAAVWAVRKGLV